jgi:radical SAM superfamily enzyme YgiQ (UPF0313 family)
MKIRFIYPRFHRFLDTYPELARFSQLAGVWKFTMPPALGLRILAALTPADIAWSLTDANVEPVDYDEDVDLVAISFFTPQASSAYEIAAGFRARGVTVVMGGMHPSMAPEDAKAHCDAVCVGEAEGIWPRILDDFRAGRLQPSYGPEYPEPSQWVKPAQGVFGNAGKYDWPASLLQVARGCPHHCPYCNIPGIYGRKIRLRDIDSVIEEATELQGQEFYITEDVIMFQARAVMEYTTALFERLAELNDLKIFLTSALAFNNRPKFLELLARGGVESIYLTFGFDAISERINRGDRAAMAAARAIVEGIRAAGIQVHGAFAVGFDGDGPDVFDHVLEFADALQMHRAEFFIATPFPNTPLWHQLHADKRILHTDWSKYNTANVVFQPKQMTAEQLTRGYLRMWTEYYGVGGPAVAAPSPAPALA